MTFSSGAGYGEAMRSHEVAPLSCHTPPQWSLPVRRAATPGVAL